MQPPKFKPSFFSVVLAIYVAGCAPVLPQRPLQTGQTATSSQTAGNPRASQPAAVTQPSQSPARPQVQANSGARNVPENWQAIGPVLASGCKGIEVVEYFEKRVYGPERMYFIALRNNNPAAKIVVIDYRGGVNVRGQRREGSMNTTVAAGEIKQVEIDLSHNIPLKIQVARCI